MTEDTAQGIKAQYHSNVEPTMTAISAPGPQHSPSAFVDTPYESFGRNNAMLTSDRLIVRQEHS